MSHDISLSVSSLDRPVVVSGPRSVHMNRSEGDPFANCIYAALDATEFNMGMSGSQDGKFVSLADLQRALENLDDFQPDLDRPSQFAEWLKRQGFGTVEIAVGDGNTDRERQFLRDGIDLCQREGLDQLYVTFG